MGKDGWQKHREALRALIREKKSEPCADCERSDLPPEVMDLDHVRGVKSFTFGGVVNGSQGYKSCKVVEEELAKCDTRCPTCHRLRHYEEEIAAKGHAALDAA